MASTCSRVGQCFTFWNPGCWRHSSGSYGAWCPVHWGAPSCFQCNPVGTCSLHGNNATLCNLNTNEGNDQPCPANRYDYMKAGLGTLVVAERLLKIRDAIRAEEKRRWHFYISEFPDDIYVSALIKSVDLTTLRDALDELVSRSDYCWCNCNYSCACIKHDDNFCSCHCNYCTCICNYCTCNCNYGCTCTCNYSDERLKYDIKYL